jgi:hypothetical protein
MRMPVAQPDKRILTKEEKAGCRNPKKTAKKAA